MESKSRLTTKFWALIALLGCFLSPAASAVNVSLAWDPSPSNPIGGYYVHYGTNSGQYTQRVTFGNVTTATISNLVDGVSYYFAVTAYGTNTLESDFSNEILFPEIFRFVYSAPVGTNLQLVFHGDTGKLYRVERKIDLITDPTWVVVASNLSTSGTNLVFRDPFVAQRRSAYYRIAVQP